MLLFFTFIGFMCIRMYPFDLVNKKKSKIWYYPWTYYPGDGSMVSVDFIPILPSEKLKEEFVI